jgi:choline dehydrogenase
MTQTRRTFFARMAGAWLYLESKLWGRGGPPKPGDVPEYIVVGSGAGGGTVAARLAELGHSVLVLEAGDAPLDTSGTSPIGNTLPSDYQVPAFQANSSENSGMSWPFFVRHYTDEAQQRLDHKFVAEYDGIFYPRAGMLGGCTAHNAMILVYPHNADWQQIADITGDASWSPDRMRGYFEKLENCQYRGFDRFLHFFGINPSRHGFGGWLHTEKALPLDTLLEDRNLIETILGAAKAAFHEIGHFGTQLIQALESGGDPNDWRLVENNAQGIHFTPLTTANHARTGTRDLLRAAANNHRLTIQLNSVATRVLFEGNRAVGVEYLEGKKLYRPNSATPISAGVTKTVRASREVILAGGAFNTPQLLMLSGIGPAAELTRWGIPVFKPLEGVGKNLQDRYEIGVVHKMKQPCKALEGAEFKAGDPPYLQWLHGRRGVYITNGAALGVIKKSFPDRPLPDLFLFALIGDFHGYYPGYSTRFREHDYLTWAILKAHTENPYGSVTLRSKDPLEAPEINFRYFKDGASCYRTSRSWPGKSIRAKTSIPMMS